MNKVVILSVLFVAAVVALPVEETPKNVQVVVETPPNAKSTPATTELKTITANVAPSAEKKSDEAKVVANVAEVAQKATDKNEREATKPQVAKATDSKTAMANTDTKTKKTELIKDKVTVIVMNWERQDKLRKDILPRYQADPTVHQVLVSHGKRETAFETPDLSKIRHYDHSQENAKIGLIRRYLTAQDAQTEAVLYVDDDIYFDQDGMRQLLQRWKDAPLAVHGVDGRALQRNSNGRVTYAAKTVERGSGPYTEVGMIITSCAMTSKEVAAGAFKEYPVFDEFIHSQNTQPLWNGEDIFLSTYSAYKAFQANPGDMSKVFPRQHNLNGGSHLENYNSVQGDDNVSISKSWSGHQEFRGICFETMVDHYKNLGVPFERVTVAA